MKRALWLALLVGACQERASTPAGERPEGPGEPWSACEQSGDCDPLEFCARPTGEPGFCTEPCDPPGDAESCPAAPSEAVARTCATIGDPPANLCALDCEEDGVCPGGMRCLAVLTAEGGRSLCF